jgi:V/A-type H+-transporting ATPase subunit E
MAFEDILKRIREDGGKESGRIRKEAAGEAEKILREAKKEAVSLKERMLHTARASIRDEKKRILTMANLEVRKKLLERKQVLIEEAFRKASNHLGHLPEEEYRRTMKKMLLETVESGEEEVIIAPEEKLINPAFLNAVNEELSSTGRPGKLKLSSERREGKGGFVLRAGRKEVNNTFDSLFKEKREDLESEVAGILFGS